MFLEKVVLIDTELCGLTWELLQWVVVSCGIVDNYPPSPEGPEQQKAGRERW